MKANIKDINRILSMLPDTCFNTDNNYQGSTNIDHIRRLFSLDYSECGTSPFKPAIDARARIVGGQKAKGRNWPWAVRVFVGGTFNTLLQYSNVIIIPVLLLTFMISFR